LIANVQEVEDDGDDDREIALVVSVSSADGIDGPHGDECFKSAALTDAVRALHQLAEISHRDSDEDKHEQSFAMSSDSIEHLRSLPALMREAGYVVRARGNAFAEEAEDALYAVEDAEWSAVPFAERPRHLV
jgi:hypothetical protein